MARRLKKSVKRILAVVSLVPAGVFLKEEGKPSEKESSAEVYVVSHEETGKDLSAWKEINPQVKYVLIVPEEEQDRVFPVVATADAEHAMSFDVYGHKDAMGQVFCAPHAVEPENLVLYGHSAKTRDLCFTFLSRMEEDAYFRSHSQFFLESELGLEALQVVSVARYDLKEEETWLGWAQEEFGSEEQMRDMFLQSVPYILQKNDGIAFQDHCVTLVTCDMKEEDVRLVVQAVRTGTV